ncbi:MAG: dihydrodipicolinate synthase family protein [Bryobacteraceae bacterium]
MAFRNCGAFAALATPIHENGEIDFNNLDRVLELVLEAGVDGVCLTGATGEYVHLSVQQRARLASHASAKLNGRGTLLVAIGASSTPHVLELGRSALDAGAEALLLPMPYFFRYEQDDLEAFCREVPNRLQAPCLLYNLPVFTNGLHVDLSIRLLNSEPFIIGIKDSSGDREALVRLAASRGSKPIALMVGNDEVAGEALRSGWDGVISGVASYCPELTVALYHAFRRNDEKAIGFLSPLLEELISQIVPLPTPWAIRAGLEVRGIPVGPFALPLSPRRAAQLADYKQWFRGWLDRNLDGVRKLR